MHEKFVLKDDILDTMTNSKTKLTSVESPKILLDFFNEMRFGVTCLRKNIFREKTLRSYLNPRLSSQDLFSRDAALKPSGYLQILMNFLIVDAKDCSKKTEIVNDRKRGGSKSYVIIDDFFSTVDKFLDPKCISIKQYR